MSKRVSVEQFQQMMQSSNQTDLVKALRELMRAEKSVEWVREKPLPLGGWIIW